MYTPAHRRRVIGGECCHLIEGGAAECPNYASKCWVYLEEGPELKLLIGLVLPVCEEHTYTLRALLNNKTGGLNGNNWELIDRNSSNYYLIEESLY
jgi:hypothetical protein